MTAPTRVFGRRFVHAPGRPRPIAVSVATNPAPRSLRCAEMGSGTGWRADRPQLFHLRAPTKAAHARLAVDRVLAGAHEISEVGDGPASVGGGFGVGEPGVGVLGQLFATGGCLRKRSWRDACWLHGRTREAFQISVRLATTDHRASSKAADAESRGSGPT